jgi:hypothetical protein
MSGHAVATTKGGATIAAVDVIVIMVVLTTT